MRYFWSDTHFHHSNIIGYCSRPFEDVGKMNEELIENHNMVVDENDVSISLGDFSISKDVEKIRDIVNKLNGTKVIITGNHDPKERVLYEAGFDLVLTNMTMTLPTVGRIFFRHLPIWKNEVISEMLHQKNCRALVHGHIHNNSSSLQDHPQLVNLSVEMINYIPICENELISKIQNKAHRGNVHARSREM